MHSLLAMIALTFNHINVYTLTLQLQIVNNYIIKALIKIAAS